jgi:hypothetical protein
MYADALLGVLAFGGWVVLFYGPWQSLCTDWARQLIFESRDAIFDLAAFEGRLDFDSYEYRIIRSSLQNLIRFAHDFTWIQLAIFLVAGGDLQGRSGLSMAMKKIDDPVTCEKVRRQVDKAQRAMILMMACKSLPLLILLILTQISRNIRNYVKPKAIALRESVQLEADLSCP